MTTRHEDDGQHHYLEETPLTDTVGHELVHPEAIDQEDELDTDFIAEADDSGDNDYVMCDPTEEEGYDDDRLAYFGEGDNNQDEEDYEPNHQNNEIRHQEVTGEATYVANDTDNSDIPSDEEDDQQHYESYEEEEDDDGDEELESDDSGSGENASVTGQESNPISLDDDDD